MIVLTILLLLFCFYVLVKSADFFVSSATVLGKRAGLSMFIIGLTIVAIGTSLPEFFTALSGVLTSTTPGPFVIGTILGSNISNILLIFGIVLFVGGVVSKISILDKIMLFVSSLALFRIIIFGELRVVTAIFFLMIYILYVGRGLRKLEKTEEDIFDLSDKFYQKRSTFMLILFIIIGIALLQFSSRGIVYAIELIGGYFSIPSAMLTLTSVAFATSLPEVVVTISSIRKGKKDVALGNIIGSNVSNVFFIFGIIGIIKQFTFTKGIYNLSLGFLGLATLLFILFSNDKFKKSRLVGIGFLLLYVTYVVLAFL